jgi:hypothetical protein
MTSLAFSSRNNSELFQVAAQVFQRVHPNRGSSRTQFLPVGLLLHQTCALGLNHVNGVGHVLAQLRIAQYRQNRLWKRQRQLGVQHGLIGGCVAHRVASAGDSCVLARISAM